MRVYLLGSGSQAQNIISIFEEYEFTQISLESINQLPASSSGYFCPAVGDWRKSHLASREMEAKGYLPLTLIHPTAQAHQTSHIGLGAQLFPNSYVGPRATLESYAVINTGAIVEHDCTVGTHSFISPGAVVLGGVEVGAFVTIGANATILPGLRVAQETTVGASSTLTKDIHSRGRTLIGTPAREATGDGSQILR